MRVIAKLCLLSGLCSVSFASGCGRQVKSTASQVENIFGADDRVEVTSGAFPFSAIGLLQNDRNGECTGALVGRNVVLTNAHCISGNDGELYKMFFSPGFAHDHALGTALVTSAKYGTTNDKNYSMRHDWAVLTLDKNLGDTLGWFAIGDLKDPGTGWVQTSGYPGDFFAEHSSPSYQAKCFIHGEDAGLLLHDCDTDFGASGSPIWQHYGSTTTLVALNAGQTPCADATCRNIAWSTDTPNWAVKIEEFKAAVAAAAASAN